MLGSEEAEGHTDSLGKEVSFCFHQRGRALLFPLLIVTRKQAYYKYLESSHWKQLRQEAFARDNHQCRHCGTTRRLRGHHIRYHKDLYLCTVDDILTLCEPCHEAEHRRLKWLRKRNSRRKINVVKILLNFDALG